MHSPITSFERKKINMAAASNPLVAYMEARPEGWKAAREAIKAGLTKEKDDAIMLDMSTDLAMLYNTAEIKQIFKTKVSNGEAVDNSAKVLLAALEKHDTVAGGQLFLISQLNGDVAVVWTKDSWNKAQLKIS